MLFLFLLLDSFFFFFIYLFFIAFFVVVVFFNFFCSLFYSGAVVRAKSAPQGELYAKWKRNSNRKVGREGDEDDQSRAPEATVSGGRGRRGRLDHGTTNEGTGDGGRGAKDELRNKAQIHKAKQKVTSIQTTERDSMYGHTYSKSMDQPGKVASPARGRLNRENEYFPVRVCA